MLESQVLYVVLSVIVTLILGGGTFYRFFIGPALKYKSDVEKWRSGVEHEIDKLKTKQNNFDKLGNDVQEVKLTLARIEERLISISKS